MADNVGTVAGIYAAFGRGDVPWIIDQLDDDVAWEQGVRQTGLPYLVPGRGKAHVAAFFQHVADTLVFTHFAPGTPCDGGDTVLIPVWFAGRIEGGGEIPMSIEAHEWQFGPDGKVTSFRHIGDWETHERAAAVRAEAYTGRVMKVVGDDVEVLRGGGEFEMFRVTGPEKSGPPPHAHPWSESFYVLDGEIDVMVGDDWQRVAAGGSATVPAGSLHAYRIASPTAAFLVTTSGARASAFFADVDAHVPPGPPDDATLPVLIDVARRNGLTSPLFG
jgi:quercetin dioxygenase-like cupin family protein/ketosteroid isomerase-like protein